MEPVKELTPTLKSVTCVRYPYSVGMVPVYPSWPWCLSPPPSVVVLVGRLVGSGLPLVLLRLAPEPRPPRRMSWTRAAASTEPIPAAKRHGPSRHLLGRPATTCNKTGWNGEVRDAVSVYHACAPVTRVRHIIRAWALARVPGAPRVRQQVGTQHTRVYHLESARLRPADWKSLHTRRAVHTNLHRRP